MLINKYVNFRKPPPAPLALKSKRQLDFTQPIELALGCTNYFAKTKKNKNPLDSIVGTVKKCKQCELPRVRDLSLTLGLKLARN